MCFDYPTFFWKMLYFPSLVAAILAFFKKLLPMYKVANATEFLVMTGYGIEEIKLVRNAWVLPSQVCSVINISPVNYTIKIQVVTSDNLSFILPAVLTIGPCTDDMGTLQTYARLLSSYDMKSDYVKEIIKGEALAHAASTSIRVILEQRKEFKGEVLERVRIVLKKLGLWVYGVNFKPLLDVPGHDCLSCLRQKAYMEVVDHDIRYIAEVGAQWQEVEKKVMIFVDTKVKLYQIENDSLLAQANMELAILRAKLEEAFQEAE